MWGGLQVTGSAVPVVEDVAQQTPGAVDAGFSFSRLGSLVYIPHAQGSRSARRKLVWVNRNGSPQFAAVPPHDYEEARFSPDGRRLAVCHDFDIWLYDIARETFSRLTFGGNNRFPVWSPDGKRLAFASIRDGPYALFWKPADGSGPDELLMRSEGSASPQDWSAELWPSQRRMLQPDFLFGCSHWPASASHGLFTKHRSLKSSRRSHWTVAGWPTLRMSRDGSRFTSSRFPAPAASGRYQQKVARNRCGGRTRGSSFTRNGGKMMVVNVTTQPSFTAAKPRMLFEGHYAAATSAQANYDVTPDGQRFVMVKPSEQELAATQINVVLNWFEDLKRRVGPGESSDEPELQPFSVTP
jgi:eukaryotic-like serine/threonine-protein kinase